MGETGAAIRPAPGASSLIIATTHGAPPVHIAGISLFGRLRVDGGELELIDCSLERSEGGPSGGDGRRLNAPGAERALSIVGGDVTLARTTVHGHSGGAVRVEAARLVLVACTLRECHALRGGALLVADGANVTIVGTNMTGNMTGNHADMSGGAIQVSTESPYMQRNAMLAPDKRAFRWKFTSLRPSTLPRRSMGATSTSSTRRCSSATQLRTEVAPRSISRIEARSTTRSPHLLGGG